MADEYEILPHQELKDLKEELRKLKEFEITPSKQMHVTMIELNHKLDKLITIFEDAMHEVRVEEGGLSFTEKMQPIISKMNKILEQNSEIASGILAIADMVKGGEKPEPTELPELPELPTTMPRTPMPRSTTPGAAPRPQPPMTAQRAPPKAPIPQRSTEPPLPPLPKKRSFGL